MPVIEHMIEIHAPIGVYFDLARHVEVHTKTVGKTRERAVAGITEGLLQLGDTVTWEAIHFGIRQRLTAKIIEMDPPYRFIDVMVKGAFKAFTHTHEFCETEKGTIMIDTFDYTSPLGFLGTWADNLFLEKYIRAFIADRSKELKKIAESCG